MFGGKGMGGGNGRGNILRTVSRAVTTRASFSNGGLQEPLSSSSSSSSSTSNTNTPSTPTSRPTRKPNSSNSLCLSSASSFPFCSYDNSTISANSAIPTWPDLSQYDEFEWVSVNRVEGEEAHGHRSLEGLALGPVPSTDEVQYAVSTLHQVFGPLSHSPPLKDIYPDLDKDIADGDGSPIGLRHRVSSVGSELDWVEPSLHPCNSRMLQTQGVERVYDAFCLLQTEPTVQRMVMALSSDKAVWDAVLNNEVVRELRESFDAVGDNVLQIPDESANSDDASMEATNIARWIFDNTKAKAMDVIEKIMNLVNDLFQSGNEEDKKTTTAGNTPNDHFQEKMRTSFLLSIVVMLIVVVTRAHTA